MFFIYRQDGNPTICSLAKMSQAIRGIVAKIELGDILIHDKFPELKVDCIIATSSF